MIVRSKREPEYAWEKNRDNMSEQMLERMTHTTSPQITGDVPPAIDLGPPVADVPAEMVVSDLYD